MGGGLLLLNSKSIFNCIIIINNYPDFIQRIIKIMVNKPLVITDSIESTMVASVDVGLSMQNVITAAESLDLGIVPIGGVRRSPNEVIKLLKLPEIINKYDEDLNAYLKDIGREQEVDWSTNTMSIYQYVYYPEVYPSLKKQGFKNEK